MADLQFPAFDEVEIGGGIGDNAFPAFDEVDIPDFDSVSIDDGGKKPRIGIRDTLKLRSQQRTGIEPDSTAHAIVENFPFNRAMRSADQKALVDIYEGNLPDYKGYDFGVEGGGMGDWIIHPKEMERLKALDDADKLATLLERTGDFAKESVRMWRQFEEPKLKPEEREESLKVWLQKDAERELKDRIEAKRAAGKTLNEHERSIWNKMVVGAAENAGYVAQYTVPGGVGLSFATSAAERTTRLSTDEFDVDDDGNLYLSKAGDDIGTAAIKGITGAAAETAIEVGGGKVVEKVLGKSAGLILKGVGKKAPVTANLIGKVIKKYVAIAKATKLGEPIGETWFEEYPQALFDSGIGLDLKQSEMKGKPFAERMVQAHRDFDPVEVMLSMAFLMGGQAAMSTASATMDHKTLNRNLDNILKLFGGLEDADLKGVSTKDKILMARRVAGTMTPEKVEVLMRHLDAKAQRALKKAYDRQQFYQQAQAEGVEPTFTLGGDGKRPYVDTKSGIGIIPEDGKYRVVNRDGADVGVFNSAGEAIAEAKKQSQINVVLDQQRQKKADYALKEAERLAGGMPVRVFNTEAEMLQEFPEIGESPDYQEGITGVRHKGGMVLILDNLVSPSEVVRTIMHEGGAHEGIRRVLGDKGALNQFLGNLAGEQFELGKRRLKLGEQEFIDQLTEADEALAMVYEHRLADPTAYQKSVAWLHDQLRKVTPNLKYTDADIEVLMADAQQKVMQAEGNVERSYIGVDRGYSGAKAAVEDARARMSQEARAAEQARRRRMAEEANKPRVAPVDDDAATPPKAPAQPQQRGMNQKERRAALIAGMEQEGSGISYPVEDGVRHEPYQDRDPAAQVETQAGDTAKQIVRQMESDERLKARYPQEYQDALDAVDGDAENAIGLLREQAKAMEETRRVREQGRTILDKLDNKRTLTPQDVRFLAANDILGPDLYKLGYRRVKATGEWRHIDEPTTPPSTPTAPTSHPQAPVADAQAANEQGVPPSLSPDSATAEPLPWTVTSKDGSRLVFRSQAEAQAVADKWNRLVPETEAVVNAPSPAPRSPSPEASAPGTLKSETEPTDNTPGGRAGVGDVVQQESKTAPVAKESFTTEDPADEEASRQEALRKSKVFKEKLKAKYPPVDVRTDEILVQAEGFKQFKEDADPATGVVEEQRLMGRPYSLAENPIVVMEMNDGRKVIVTGRHRLDLYKRNNIETIPAHVIRESDGWTPDDAGVLDAFLNILDEKGSIHDYVKFFDEVKPTASEAEADGLTSREKGRTAFLISQSASPDVRASINFDAKYRRRKENGEHADITAAQAAAIAEAAPIGEAPENEAIQREVLRDAFKGMTPLELRNRAQVYKRQIASSGMPESAEMDLFGDYGAGLREQADKIADAISAKQSELMNLRAVLNNAINRGDSLQLTKAQAKALGITNVKDKAQLRKALDATKKELAYWSVEILDEDRMNQARRAAGVPVVDDVPKQPTTREVKTGLKGQTKTVPVEIPTNGEPTTTIVGRMDMVEFERMGYEPNEVTRQNWVDLQRAERRRLGQREEGDNPNAPWAEYEEFHRDSVKRALAKGDVVDERVLADYPELQTREVKTGRKGVTKKADGESVLPSAANAEQAETIEGRFIKQLPSGRWVVQSEENRQRAERGEREIGGNRLFASREEAVKETKREIEIARRNAAFRATQAAAQAEREAAAAKREAPLNAYLDTITTTPLQRGKLKATLSAQETRRVPSTGKVYSGSRFEVVNQMVGDGFKADAVEVDAIKDVSRVQWNRMDERQQREWDARRKAAGKKTEYRLVGADGAYYVVTKVEHDLAKAVETSSSPTAPTAPPYRDGADTQAAQAPGEDSPPKPAVKSPVVKNNEALDAYDYAKKNNLPSMADAWGVTRDDIVQYGELIPETEHPNSPAGVAWIAGYKNGLNGGAFSPDVMGGGLASSAARGYKAGKNMALSRKVVTGETGAVSTPATAGRVGSSPTGASPAAPARFPRGAMATTVHNEDGVSYTGRIVSEDAGKGTVTIRATKERKKGLKATAGDYGLDKQGRQITKDVTVPAELVRVIDAVDSGARRTAFERAVMDEIDRKALAELMENIGDQTTVVDQIDKIVEQQDADDADPDEAYEGTRFRRVSDPKLISRLENGKKVKAYRAMQLVDGKLYPPMAAKVNGEWINPTDLNTWLEAEEFPQNAFEKNGRWYFKLDKGNGASIEARYNPYFHSSLSPLNDQFTSASNRPNLVTVEVEIPLEDIESGYKADKAKDAVGEHVWKAGPVAAQLPASKARKVILSRYNKVVRIVPDSEVAEKIATLLEGEGISIPENVVTPSLKDELVKRGVDVAPAKGRSRSVRASNATVTPPGIQFRRAVTPEQDAAYLAAVARGDMKTAQRMVDEAAKAAGFGIKAYHSTDNEFTSFDPRRLGESTARNSPPEQGMSLAKLGFWFHERPLSQVLGQKHDLAVYLKLDEPLETTFDELWDNPVIENDSAIVQDTEFGGVSYIVKDPSQIKSADPVTRDDAGRVIPLSERFNEGSDDIRFRKQTETPEFKRWFGDSKVVDADGKPLVVYHGTNADFSAFDNKKLGQYDDGLFGLGHYFSADRTVAKNHGNRIVDAYVSIKKPLVVKDVDADWRNAEWDNGRRSGAELSKLLADRGYDGVIWQWGDSASDVDVVALRPDQIKSATGNRGTFDPDNPDIRFRVIPPANTTPSQEPPAEDELLKDSDYWNAIRGAYNPGESSRTKPIRELPELRVGMWRVSSLNGVRGRDIDQLRWLDPSTLSLAEDMVERNEEGRGWDADRYADWNRQGLEAPPIEVVETDNGVLRVIDGHRRVAAAKKTGKPVLAWVSPSMDVPEGVHYDGDPSKPIVKTSLTIEAWRNGTAMRTEPLTGGFSDYGIANDIRFRPVTPEQDAAYMRAVESGDMEAAQRMVDAAAKAAGYKRRVYHGTDESRNELQGGTFVTDDAKAARSYAYMKAIERAAEDNEQFSEILFEIMDEEGAESIQDLSVSTLESIIEGNNIDIDLSATGATMSLYLKAINVLDLTDEGTDVGDVAAVWKRLHKDGLVDDAWESLDEEAISELEDEYSNKTMYTLLEREGVYAKAYAKGYDAVSFMDVSPDGDVHATWIADKAMQYKSADAITRDDAGRVIPLSERFNEASNDIRFRPVTPEQDAEYLAAVERGDMATAQRMVDEAARRAGYDRETFRGDSMPDDIVVYDPKERREVGIFTTPVREIADVYANNGGRLSNASRRFYVRAPKVLDLTKDNLSTMRWVAKWAESFDEWIDPQTGEEVSAFDILQSGRMFDYEGDWSSERWMDLQATAEIEGYDAVVLPDYDSERGVFPSLVVFDSKNLKLADPVTRDYAGRVIPLSERFNDASPDIRFRKQTETPEFKRWFRDSKVVDADGKPLVVYHGTTGDFNVFDLGYSGADGVGYGAPAIFAASDPAIASDYAINKLNRAIADAYREVQKIKNENPGDYGAAYEAAYAKVTAAFADVKRTGRRETGDGANVMPVYMALQNPLVIDGKGARFMKVMPDAIARAVSGKHDGLIVNNVIDHASPNSAYPTQVLIAFRPDQIKSAIGNRGTFDPDNPDIRFRKASDADNLAEPFPMKPSMEVTKVEDIEDNYNKLMQWKKDVAAWADKAPRVLPFIFTYDESFPPELVGKGTVKVVHANTRNTKYPWRYSSFSHENGVVDMTPNGHSEFKTKGEAVIEAVSTPGTKYDPSIRFRRPLSEAAREYLAAAQAAVDAVPPKADGSVDLEERQRVLDEWKADPANAAVAMGLDYGVEIRVGEHGVGGESTGGRATVGSDTTPVRPFAADWTKRDAADFQTSREYPQNQATAAHEIVHSLFSRNPQTAHAALESLISQGVPRDQAFESLVDLGGLYLLEPRAITDAAQRRIIGDWLDAHIRTALDQPPLSLRPDGTLAGVQEQDDIRFRPGPRSLPQRRVQLTPEQQEVMREAARPITQQQDGIKRAVATEQEAPILGLIRWGMGQDVADKIDRKLGDFRIPIKRLYERVMEKGGKFNRDTMEYAALAEKRNSLFGVLADDMEERFVLPMTKALRDGGWSLDDLNHYVQALHAPYFNRMIAEARGGREAPGRQPLGGYATDLLSALEDDGWAGKGLSDAKAKETVEWFERQARADKLREAASYLVFMNRRILDQRVADGLMARQQAETWKKLSPYYVPLRKMQEAEEGDIAAPAGRNLSSREIKRAVGHFGALNENSVVNSLTQMDAALYRGLINKERQNLWRFLEANPDPDSYVLHEAVPTREVKVRNADGTFTVQQQVDQGFVRKASPQDKEGTIVPVKFDGEVKYIEFKGVNARTAARAVKENALQGRAFAASPFIRGLGHMFKGVRTIYAMDFTLRNGQSDGLDAALIMATEGKLKQALAAVKAVPHVWKVLWQHENGRPVTGPYAELFEEYRRSGSIMSNRWVDSTGDNWLKVLEKEMGIKPDHSKPVQAVIAVKDGIERLNTIVELGTRFSVYAGMRKNGASVQDAADYARNITVDFEKRGELTPVLNSVYHFSNVAIQGNRRFMQAVLKNPARGARVVGSLFATGFLTALWNMLGFDDDEYDKLKDYHKYGRIAARIPGTKKMKQARFRGIPGWIYFQGVAAAETAFGKRTIGSFAMQAPITFLDTVNWLGDSSDLLTAVLPPMLDPLAHFATNKQWTGRPLVPGLEYATHKPRSQLAYKSTPKVFKAVAEAINKLGGGDEVTKSNAMLDNSPEAYKYWWNFLTGSMLNVPTRSFDVMVRLAKGEDVPVKSVPFVRDFFLDLDDIENNEPFYQAKTAFEEVQYRYKGYDERGERGKMVELRRQYRYADRESIASERLKDMLRRIDDLKDRADAATGERKEQLNQQRVEAQRKFIELIERYDARGRHP